jgi:hypothetical protein
MSSNKASPIDQQWINLSGKSLKFFKQVVNG